jgi:hypothetical protein
LLEIKDCICKVIILGVRDALEVRGALIGAEDLMIGAQKAELHAQPFLFLLIGHKSDIIFVI